VCQWLAACLWFSLGNPDSSTNKTDCHNKYNKPNPNPLCDYSDCLIVHRNLLCMIFILTANQLAFALTPQRCVLSRRTANRSLWLDLIGESNPQSSTLKASKLTIRPPTGFTEKEHNAKQQYSETCLNRTSLGSTLVFGIDRCLVYID
jgi:hypothetical protein